jgi:hypothetical protein
MPRTTSDYPAIPWLAILTAFAQSLDLLEYWFELISSSTSEVSKRASKRERWLPRENHTSGNFQSCASCHGQGKSTLWRSRTSEGKKRSSNAATLHSSFHCSPHISSCIRASFTSLQSSYQASQADHQWVNWRLGCYENLGNYRLWRYKWWGNRRTV